MPGAKDVAIGHLAADAPSAARPQKLMATQTHCGKICNG